MVPAADATDVPVARGDSPRGGFTTTGDESPAAEALEALSAAARMCAAALLAVAVAACVVLETMRWIGK
uniref:Uncharacterized protein n=1 Tax=Peronospora matthiolae TaxID=2874970 RepID=A0AAV1T2R9_9STRA